MFDVLKQVIPEDAAAAEETRWAPLRRAPRHSDSALTGTTRQWLRGLPPRRRPLRLCIHYPRVANRIAWCWRDPVLSEQVLDDLLFDRRGGRCGFAPSIVRELKRLQQFNAAQRQELRPEGLWSAFGRLTGLA